MLNNKHFKDLNVNRKLNQGNQVSFKYLYIVYIVYEYVICLHIFNEDVCCLQAGMMQLG